MSFVVSNSDTYSASVTAMIYAISCYIVPLYNSIWLYDSKRPKTSCKILQHFNSMHLSDPTRHHISGSILVNIMACGLTAPSQCWSNINNVLRQFHESCFMRSAQDINLSNEFENVTFKITATSPRGRWVQRKGQNKHSCWWQKVYSNTLFSF